jgi:hypothetical protein
VHKDTIAVALAEAGLRGEVREHGKIPNTSAALKALTVQLAPARREAQTGGQPVNSELTSSADRGVRNST